MRPEMNAVMLLPELVYTLIIVFFCFAIYFGTKEAYELTKYRGIKLFRTAFFFFGLAYITRFVFHIMFMAGLKLDLIIPERIFFPLMLVAVTYLSTLAILYLVYSAVWKSMQKSHFIIFSNLFALSLMIFAILFRSPQIIGIVQAVLLAFPIMLSRTGRKKGMHASHLSLLYTLLSIFWIANMFILSPGRLVPHEVKVSLQLVSICLFAVIYHKMHKWIK